MEIDELKRSLKYRIPQPIDIKNKYSVLIPLIKINEKWHIIYELRASTLIAQPGEISFPGGKVEENETYEQAAIRETVEELNIEEKNINVLGELDYLISYANFTIHCFLGELKDIKLEDIKPNEAEVDHVFAVPLDYFLNHEPMIFELALKTEGNESFPYELIPKGKDYNFRQGKHIVLFYQYGDYIIWGFTARMTKQFIEIIREIGAI